MGLNAKAVGLTAKTEFNCGYITYDNFMLELIRTAYGEDCRNIFLKFNITNAPFSNEDVIIWNEKCNDDLDIWIWHSNCDGKFTPQECRKIYNAIKNLKMDVIGHNYGVMKSYNMLEHWKNIFKHCADRRVTLYFS